MLTSSEKCSEKPGKKRRKGFYASFSVLFCCVSKNKSQLKPRVVSSSVQCDILSNYSEPETVLKEDFKLSLNKLDSLINTLQDIKEKYRENDKLSSGDGKEIEPTLAVVSDNLVQDNDEITKFNVNINETTCIECITKKGKHSLTIFDNNPILASSDENEKNVLVLKKCDSEIFPTNSTSEKTLENIVELQKNYHMLSTNFGRFSSVISRHISTMRKDVSFLRSIMCKFGGKTVMSQLSLTEVCGKDKSLDKSLVKSEELKFVQAKLRASTFCRFYNMRHNQNIGKKQKSSDRNLKKHTVSSRGSKYK